jgi:aminoacyl tRNA synthase complex-interacting multifunctional protein 1
MADFIKNFKKLSLDDISTVEASVFPELNQEQKALASQFETLATRVDESETIITLNDSLRPKTFIAGNVASKADLVVFKAVSPLARKWSSAEDVASHRHILRWIDLIQNVLVEVEDKVVVDYDILLPREVKEKKKPAAAAAAAAPAAAVSPAAPAPVENAGDGLRKELTEEEKKAKADAQKAKKAARAKAKAEQNAQKAPAAAPVAITPSMVDIRVGYIQKAVKHPDADSLYMSTIDMGDAEGPRTVCSGLVKYIPLEDMQERYIVCIANLKPVTMRGVKSSAMVLCASNENTVEFVNPPAGSKPGDKLFFETFDGTPEKQLNPKKKVWEALQPHFSTSENFEVTFTEEGKEPKKLVNAKGELCKNSTIVKADVK